MSKCDTVAVAKQLQSSPPPQKKLELQWDYNCDGRIFISFVFPQFTSFPLYVPFLSWVDELIRLACSPCMVLHSSVGKARK